LGFRPLALPRMDWWIVGLTLVLSGLGILNLYSATATVGSGGSYPVYLKQAVFLFIGLCLAGLSIALDYRRWIDYAYLLFGLCMALLLFVLLFGKAVSGAQRWVSFGPVTFQPSEASKLAALLIIARYVQRNPSMTGMYGLRELFKPLAMVSALAVLIALEPDLGSAVMVLLICFSTLLFAGLRLRSILKLVLVALVALPLLWQALEPYQKERLLTYIDPQRDPLGTGYHVTQSKIAIGSGGFTGKGFRKGTQSQLHFLPEHHTDFAFSVWAEEWGFLGSMVLLGLFFLLLAYGLHVASRAGDSEGRVLAFGVVSYFFWPVVVNVGMTLGLMPVVGVALPFISYGGSSLVTSLIAVGVLINIHMRRFLF